VSDQKTITRQTLILFVFIVAMSLVPRFYNIADPATYHLHPIRQFQSLMVARNFYEQGMNLLDPRLDAGINQSVPPSPVALELQLMQYIAAGAYHVIGVKEWVGNVLAVLFFVGAAVFFFLIASKYLSTNYALLAALIFCFSPESFKYSRAFIPDFEVLFYALGSLFFFERYLISEQRKDYVLTLMFLALTFLTKINYLFVAIIILIMALARYGLRAFTMGRLWLLAVASLAPSAWYYTYASRIAEGAHNYVTSMVKGRVLPYLATNLISLDFYRVLYTNSSKYFSAVGLLLAALGLARLLWRSETNYLKSLLGGWIFAVAVYFLVMGRDLLAPHVYYFLPLLPLGSLGIAACFELLVGYFPAVRYRENLVRLVLPFIVLGAAVGIIFLLNGYYASIRPEVNLYLTAAQQLRSTTEPDDLIVYVTEDTGWTYFIMYYSHRRGWHLWQPQEKSGLEKTIRTWQRLGARYVYILSPDDYKYLPEGAFDWTFVKNLEARNKKVSTVTVGSLVELSTI